MDSDIKYALDAITTKIDDIKRINFDDIKRKIDDLHIGEIKEMLRDIKSRVEIIESKIQK